jgi:ribosomal-protein-alanine N-acetyltransferase
MLLKPVRDCLYIKWLHAGLYKHAAALESHSSENFLTENDIRKLMRKKYGMGGFVIAEINKSVGYTIYEQSKSVLKILNLVVHQDFRRQGIASLLMDRLMTRKEWTSMEVFVRESNLNAQLFFKSHGFLATGVHRNYFETNKVEDAFHFRKEKA